MSTVLDRIADAVLSALNTGAPPGMPVAIDALMDEVDPVPSITLGLMSDEVKPMSGHLGDGQTIQFVPPPGPVSKHRATFIVESRSRITDGTAARKAVEPLRAWAVKCLGNSRLGGLALGTYEGRTEYQVAQREGLYVRAATLFLVDYQTRVDDAESQG